MSEETEKKSITPHILIIGAIVVIILAVIFWPSDDEPEPVPAEQPVTQQEEPEPATETEEFERTPEPEPVEIESEREVEPMPEPEPEPEPEPLDVSDDAVKASLADISASNDEAINRILMDEAVLQRFVVAVTNVANDELATNYRLVSPPEQSFRVYTQAGKKWIDAASYKRYTPYVDMLESFENEALLDLYETYQPDIQQKYSEIGDPDRDFDNVIVEAIDQLLDTPEVPMPVEVYTDSVAYKYADEQLENLSSPQKQLLRTGPDNMRRIKAKLRELKALLQDNGS
ncbi:DUF3014 domain-containing protein [Alteromonas halophila]|uniref:DUF3014 domain-containing protein n=1 Tax=Alteromonas halophila TaxID=516698 RepID=A0A918JNF5_9ALTE|nr:DUF3014 domain-containing protein [Alteromonas halophila]GGW91439.1 hypothetical protein GCM10007391_27250 [Alteromonas halophila]